MVAIDILHQSSASKSRIDYLGEFAPLFGVGSGENSGDTIFQKFFATLDFRLLGNYFSSLASGLRKDTSRSDSYQIHRTAYATTSSTLPIELATEEVRQDVIEISLPYLTTVIPEIEDKLAEIFRISKCADSEDEAQDEFSNRLLELINSYQSLAVNVIEEAIQKEDINPNFVYYTLATLGVLKRY